jgi:hypothetical protein
MIVAGGFAGAAGMLADSGVTPIISSGGMASAPPIFPGALARI